MTLTNTQFDQLKRDYATLKKLMYYKSMEQFIVENIFDNLEMAKEDERSSY